MKKLLLLQTFCLFWLPSFILAADRKTEEVVSVAPDCVEVTAEIGAARKNEALEDVYAELCERGRAEQCLALACLKEEFHDANDAKRRFHDGCDFGSAAACFALGRLDEAAGHKRAAKKYYVMACEQLYARACAKLGGGAAEVVPALARHLSDKELARRAAVISLLGQMGPEVEGVVPALIKALDDSDASIRAKAAKTLGKMGPAAKEAVPVLVQRLIQDREKLFIRDGLAGIGADAVPELQEVAADASQPKEVTAAAKKALEAIQAKEKAAKRP